MQIFGDKKFEKPVDIITAFNNDEFKKAFNKIESLRKQDFYILGYIRYDARKIFDDEFINSEKPLLYFEIFDKYEDYFPQNICQNYLISAKPKITKKEYHESINRIKDEISAGNTYEVNYTYDWQIESNLSGIDLYQSILQNQKTPYNAYIKNKWDEILSFSPELFFELNKNHIKAKPMKGTIKRGVTPEIDKKNVEFLQSDEKNRAENVMIVDLLRNDLGKMAKTGTVKVDKLFEVETHKTVHQMTSEISAELEENTTLYDIFKAIYPCGSITGAPKINTIKIIDAIETGKREIYCGAIGLITKDSTIFSVPIRVLEKYKTDKNYTCRVGGAIVWDSTAESEWEETLTKIDFINCQQANDLKIIETIKVENKKMLYKKKHFKRMKKTASALGFKFNYDILRIEPKNDGMMRILLSKSGEFEVEYKPLISTKCLIAKISQTKVNSNEMYLKYKTTYRPWYENSFEKIKNNLVYDEIFLNEKNEVTEGARSNIVIKKDDEYFTPPLHCGLLNGILRENLLEKGKLTKKVLFLDDLKNADKVYCINSVRGMVEVKVDFN